MTTTPHRPWADVISADDEERYERAGFGRPSGWGDRPALLIIDMQYRTIGNSPKPFYERSRTTRRRVVRWGGPRWSRSCACSRRSAPRADVLYPHVAPKLAEDRGGTLGQKVPGIMDVPDRGYEFPEQIAPRSGDLLLPKKHPSAFFGTPLASYLIGLGVDTLVVTGCTTSGCVRGTVVDAFSYNFKCVIPADAVYDRAATVHQVNLFDLAQKYADVLTTDEVVQPINARWR